MIQLGADLGVAPQALQDHGKSTGHPSSHVLCSSCRRLSAPASASATAAAPAERLSGVRSAAARW